MSKIEVDTYVNLKILNVKEFLPTFFGISENHDEVVKFTFSHYIIDDDVNYIYYNDDHYYNDDAGYNCHKFYFGEEPLRSIYFGSSKNYFMFLEDALRYLEAIKTKEDNAKKAKEMAELKKQHEKLAKIFGKGE